MAEEVGNSLTECSMRNKSVCCGWGLYFIHSFIRQAAVHYAIYTRPSPCSSPPCCVPALLTGIPSSPDLTLLSLTLECELCWSVGGDGNLSLHVVSCFCALLLQILHGIIMYTRADRSGGWHHQRRSLI